MATHGPATSWMGDTLNGSWAMWCDDNGVWFAAKRARVGEGVLAEGEEAPLPEWMSRPSGIEAMLWGAHGEEEK